MENEYETKNPVGKRGRGKPVGERVTPEPEVELAKAVTTPAATNDAGRGNGDDDGTRPPLGSPGTPFVVSLDRSQKRGTADQSLWVVIRNSTNAIGFNRYDEFMDIVMCGGKLDDDDQAKFRQLKKRKSLPFPDVEPYRLMKIATEVFLLVNCGVAIPAQGTDINALDQLNPHLEFDQDEEELRYHRKVTEQEWGRQFEKYIREVENGEIPSRTFPYLALIREKLGDIRLTTPSDHKERDFARKCFGILRTKLTMPCLLELVWSYWQEEGMLVQTLNAISIRFQNKRGPADRDPLANLEIDPLRPLNNLLWGYIQDEQHRLTVQRRAYEYDHHYGLSLYGKAVSELRTADSRSKFLEAFHNLLHLAAVFYRQDDDTTVVADGFPLLNALRDVHIILSEGAHNQFGDLPSTARQEMLMQQWLLARPEMREFLPTRVMVAYPEPWMDRIDAMKKLQGWTDTSILHFRYLAVFGEQILLSIRFGAWSDEQSIHPEEAANWARYWRPEIQGYIHAYNATTGVDLSADVTDTRRASDRFLQPSVHLRNRLAAQRQGR
jgi:hypothetical protein